ncbi:uncharacterized protein BP01DRAFT_300672 [Aspergillus saccharolyticus JOP 1030-1]|uniref:Acid protease n=1 Tax=Aspergillus saccharolyticus JOP 1030-1 TaxID=1450539 RepID=A0A318Z8L6_9EURO|nr:hypothetical protein BP01DRAFT_300672 [Aspergillus saccharolyticus JOP 1030-1]PYH43681.1 hypothetical protein BP01DRAFT_300672 [Aspergillus saccharolyticus JOP 1030-1]
MASKLAHLLFAASLGLLASAQLAVDTSPVTAAAASVETVSMIDASGLPITTASDAAANAWYIPLTGPASAATAAWGASVHIGSSGAEILPITFGTIATPTHQPTATVFPAGAPSGDTSSSSSSLEIALNSAQDALLLGADSTVSVLSTVIATADSPTNISSTNLTSLPVGLNLGLAGHWPGALVFGGNYDANRIYNETHWQTTAATSAGESTFIATGAQSVGKVQLHLYASPATTETNSPSTNDTTYPFATTTISQTTQPLPATLNFSRDTLTVPDASFCDRNFTIGFNADSATYPRFEIAVWADLVPAGSRCVADAGAGAIVLGRPFFQAAYVYVTAGGDLYFSSIRRDGAVGVAPREFDLHAVLGGGNGNGTGDGDGAQESAVSGAGRGRGTLGGGWGLVWMAVVVALGELWM